jgi:hypothetical protein
MELTRYLPALAKAVFKSSADKTEDVTACGGSSVTSMSGAKAFSVASTLLRQLLQVIPEMAKVVMEAI